MKTLEGLFGAEERVRMLNLFLKNDDDEPIEKKDVIKRTELREPTVRKELDVLKKIGFLKEKKKKNLKFYTLDTQFPYYKELRQMILKAEFEPDKDMINKIKKVGRVKFCIIAGHLISEPAANAELLLVGENLDDVKVAETITSLEASVGQEIRYSTMNLEEFLYRCEMCDRFTLELLKGPHREIINTLDRLPKQAVQ